MLRKRQALKARRTEACVEVRSQKAGLREVYLGANRLTIGKTRRRVPAMVTLLSRNSHKGETRVRLEARPYCWFVN